MYSHKLNIRQTEIEMNDIDTAVFRFTAPSARDGVHQARP